MMKNYILSLLSLFVCAFTASAQVTSDPSPLQEDSQNVAIFFHADQGNKQMMGLPATAAVYAHTGACLSNGQQWVNPPSWDVNDDKYKMTYVSPNLWKLEIGDLRSFYNIADPAVNITKLAFVFRTGDRSKEGKAEGNKDIFLDVVDAGLQVAITSNVAGSIITPSTGEVTFKVGATKAANLALFINGTEIAAAIGQKELSANYTFTTPGSYTVKATANTDSEEAETEQTYFYASDSAQKDYPGGNPVMGPVKLSDGTVRFCLGAPGKKSVAIIGAWNDYTMTDEQVMNYCDVDGLRYFWIDIKGLENDKMYGYYFLVDGDKKVGDPYARLVLDPWNDKYILTDVFPNLPAYPEDKIEGVPLAIYQGNINHFDWQVDNFKGADPSNLIIYELLFRDFTGTEGQAYGNGTVNMAIEKIPYLKTLGVNAIEVLPITEFSGNISWGYNPNFYFAPDKAYGTPDDYKNFIDICHQNGIAVILDIVFNQADGLHPWYQMYEPGENPFFNLNAPHAYSVFNDWNQGFPLVQQQWADALRYWLTEYRFDGFRFDLVKGLGLNESYANSGDAATNAYNASRVEVMRGLQKVVESVNPNAYFINENLATAKEENEMAATGELNWANVNNAGCQFAMGYSSDSNMNRFYAPQDGSRLWGSTVSYLESHDEQRLAYKQDQYGASGVKGNLTNSLNRLGSAAAQMILAPGAHMIWQFSELGNYDNTKNASGGNDTDPKPVRWSLLDNPQRHGLYDCYAELISLRNKNPKLFAETASFSIQCNTNNWNNGRTLVSKADGMELYTVINPLTSGNLTVTINFEKNDDSAYKILSKSYESSPSFSAAGKTVTVPANCYVVVGSTDVAAVEGVEIDTPGKDIDVYTLPGEIVVANAGGKVRIYSSDGQLTGVITDSGRMNVAPGIYILRTSGKTVKIAVR